MPSNFATGSQFHDIFRDRVPINIIPDEFVSSRSEHDGGADHDGPDCSVNLSQLVYSFLMDEEDAPTSIGESDCEDEFSIKDWSRYMVQSKADSYRNSLFDDVVKGIEVFCSLDSKKPLLRWNVMLYLRNLGYDASICKTKWESSTGLTAGNYEFIDILRSDSGDRVVRYIVDMDFATEFEIARPTAQYERLVKLMPKIFVGIVEDLKRNLKVLSDEAKQSMKSLGFHLPPWRKHRYMQNKWLGPYKRTTNVFPAANSPVLQPSPSLRKHQLPVKCRAIGFETSVVNDSFVLPAITQTR